jgi:hypothetical protein
LILLIASPFTTLPSGRSSLLAPGKPGGREVRRDQTNSSPTSSVK